MTITITGENSFAVRRKLHELANNFTAEHGELALEKFDAEEADAQAIADALTAMPFLSTRKMTIVRNGSANKEFVERIEQIISSSPDSTDLVLLEPELDKRTAYLKVLKKHTKFFECHQLDKPELAKWLVEEANNINAKLNLANANYLVERLGQNQENLFNELSKLALYDSEISRQSINLLTDPAPQSRIFDLLDAAFAGRKSRALELYEDQRAQKIEPERILAMIAWQLNLLAYIKISGGNTLGQVAKDIGMNPYPVNKAAGLANKLDQAKLRAMVNDALEIDIKGKTTVFDMDEALKTYITTL